jgi:O-acetyl-ADP-ribose deacetylase (regulator of RNase III)
MITIELVRESIVAQTTDAIVNAANPTLMGGGNVDGIIHSQGGPRIKEECEKIRQERYPKGLPTGEAVATTAGDLPCRFVIHTVGPIYGRSKDPSRELSSCFVSCLRVADELNLTSIAFPAISTGAYAYPLKEAAEISLRAVMQCNTKVALVRFALFDGKAFDAFSRAWKLLENTCRST